MELVRACWQEEATGGGPFVGLCRVPEVPGEYTKVEAHVRAEKRDESASAGQTLVAASPRNSIPTRRVCCLERIEAPCWNGAASLAVRLSPATSHP